MPSSSKATKFVSYYSLKSLLLWNYDLEENITEEPNDADFIKDNADFQLRIRLFDSVPVETRWLEKS